jgi:hypothetical protein
LADQAVIKDHETLDIEYSDNTPLSSKQVSEDEENERIMDFISNATSEAQLNECEPMLTTDEQRDAFMDKLSTFKTAE